MRHHILPILLSFTLTLPPIATTSQTTTDLTAQIRPSFYNTCPPNDTTTTNPTKNEIHPRTHRPIPKPIPIPKPSTFSLHPGTCQSIPVPPPTTSSSTSTSHVSFDTQIEGSASHCNVTLHELPGCVDTPLLTTQVDGTESGKWVGSECVRRTSGSPSPSPSPSGNGDMDEDENVNMNMWVMLECDASTTASDGSTTTEKDHDDEDEDDDTSNGNVHAEMDQSGNGTSVQQQQQQQNANKVNQIGSMHGGLLNGTNGTGVHGANWNVTTGRMNLTTVHGVGNRTVGWRVLARRNWKKRILGY